MDNKMVFKQVNFFHVLYSSPKTTYKRVVSLSRLPALTQLLIERGHDVKARLPSRTYPLYSLIHNAFCTFIRNDFFFSECFIACMMMLMENGADPNFDEVCCTESRTNASWSSRNKSFPKKKERKKKHKRYLDKCSFCSSTFCVPVDLCAGKFFLRFCPPQVTVLFGSYSGRVVWFSRRKERCM